MRKDFDDEDSVGDDDPRDDVSPVPDDAPGEVGPRPAWVTHEGARQNPEQYDNKDATREQR